MLKRLSKIMFVVVLMIGLGISNVAQAANGKEEVINEKFGPPIIVYGGNLTAEQKQKVKELLDIVDRNEVKEITVTGTDAQTYIDGDPNSRMFSSAKITRKDKGEGLVINQITPENITEVTDEMYANALLTAGIEDAQVDVVSPVKVTGHSALTGIYKAYEASGGNALNKDRLEVANEELNVVTDLAKQEGLDKEKASELITAIKSEMAEQNPATKEEVQQIVEEQLNSFKIELSPEDRQLLIDLFDKMRSLEIDFNQVKTQLEDISNDIQKKIEEVAGDEGFWQGIVDFIKGVIDSIGNLFK